MLSYLSESHVVLLVLPESYVLGFKVLAIIFCLVGFLALWLFPGGLAWAISKPGDRAAIPGPRGYPFTGLLYVFNGLTPHRSLARLSRSFNATRLMAFSLGFTRFVVSSDPETAREILNSPVFTDRPVKESAHELLFHRAMGFAPYGDYWRKLRRISAVHLFCQKKVFDFEGFRGKIGKQMVGEIRGIMGEKGQVKVRKVLRFGSLNNVMMSVFGKSYKYEETEERFELENLVNEGYELLGMVNLSDNFPFLQLLDFQGVRKRCRILVSKVNLFVGKIIEEHKTKRVCENNKVGDIFLDGLLQLKEEDKLSETDIIAIMWEMIFRGTDTIAILLEWVLARMALHQEIQAKAQDEIDRVVGKSRLVSEVDVLDLPYLQSIVKEALRLHPPGPLLSWARLSVHDTHIDGHFIPAGTTGMVNMWAITHDEKVWTEPDEFRPDRFMEESVNIMGCDLRLAPFGSGRRICPGKAMGLATVHLWLAQLLQSFTWLPCREQGVDLSEKLKLSLEMKTPLVCRVIPRLASNLFTKLP